MFGFGFDGWTLASGHAAGGRYVTLPAYASVAGFGDSITAGTGVATAANRWLNRIGSAVGATVLNAGIAGTVLQNSPDSGGSPRADNGRNRFVAALTGANLKQAVFIAYGFNDARYVGAPATLNATNFANDYREVLNGLRSRGYARGHIYVLAPYFITDTGLNTGSPGFAGQTRGGFEAFVTAAEAVAREFGVRFCNLYDALNTPAFIANVDGNDHIHPTDAGHAAIAAAIRTRTVEPNTRAAPASVTATLDGSVMAASCEAVSGATGYEFVAVSGNADSAAQTGASPSATFSGLAAGAYRLKARATFGDGPASPWTFAAADATVSAPPAFIQDSFTDTAGVQLPAHAPEAGGAWVAQPGVTNNVGVITAAGRLRPGGTSCMFQATAAPPSADHYAEADLVYLSTVTNVSGGVAVRMDSAAHTAYWARYQQGTGWQLYKTVAGVSTQLGTSQANPVLAAGQPRRIRLEVAGSADPVLTLKADGTAVLTVTDNTGTRIASGRAGVRCQCPSAVTDSTGIHIDNFSAGAL